MRRRRRTGFILPIGMVLSAALLALGLALSNLARYQLLLALSRVRTEQAQAAADGALVVGLAALTANPSYTGTTADTLLGSGPEVYDVDIFKAGTTIPGGRTVPTNCIYILGTGKAGRATRQAGAMLQLGTSSGGLKGVRGIMGTSVILGNGAYVNSYSSLKGPYTTGRNGSVSTNSNGYGAVRVLGGAQIYGPVFLGPGSTVEKTTTYYNVGQNFTFWHDWGTTYGDLTVMEKPVDTPAVSMPAIGTADAKLDWSSKSLGPGAYRDVTVSNGASITLSPGTYVMRSLSLQGGARITLTGNGPVQIFVQKNFDLANGVTFGDPTLSRPQNLQLYMGEGSSYNHAGGATMTGVVYAPGIAINMSNAATLYGALVGGPVNLQGSARVCYDETLSDFSLTGVGSGSSTTTTTILFRERY